MADDNRPEDPEAVSGEIMPTHSNIPTASTRNPLRRLFDELFHFPLWKALVPFNSNGLTWLVF
jgi:hypothetical protein